MPETNLKRNRFIFAGLLIIQFLPYLLLWDDAYIRIHDTLEGEWIWWKILLDSGHLLDYDHSAVVDQVMNGLDRRAYNTGLSFHPLWVSIFGLYGGYIFNYLLTHVVAFVSMFVLLKKHFLKEDHQELIVLGASLCFSWVPFFSAFGMTVAAQPLLFFAAFNLLEADWKWWNFLIVLVFPFYASLVWAAPPVLLCIGLIWLFSSVKNGTWNFALLTAILGLTLCFILVNWQMLSLIIDPGDFVSHRESYDYFFDKEIGFLSSLGDTLMVFFITHYHVGTLVTVPILVAFITSIYYQKRSEWTKVLFFGILGISLFFGFYDWIVYFCGDLIPLLYTFKFDRISILLPCFWMLLFALSLARIKGDSKYSSLICAFIAAQFLITAAGNDEFLHNVRHLSGFETKPSYKSFMAEDLFEEVKTHIGEPTESFRVVSLGLNPSVSQVNGFYTLDGLQSVYDADYKSAFRKIMEEELTKNEEVRKYFDAWGNRCYIFSSELGWRDKAFMIPANSQMKVDNISLDTDQFFNMGGRFILSSLPIGNDNQLNLRLERKFDHPDSFWSIYLYAVERKTSE